MEKKQRIAAYDIIRAVATLLVVQLHVASYGFYAFSDQWLVGVAYNALGRAAVPVFFMLSGILLIPRSGSICSLASRTVFKIILPYVCWAFIYIIYNNAAGIYTISPLRMFFAVPYYHLGFMLNMISIYLMLPLLRGFWNSGSTSLSHKRYVIVLALAASQITGFIPMFSSGFNLNFLLSGLPYFAAYALIGVYVNEAYVKRNPKGTPLLWALGYLLSTALIVLTIYFDSNRAGAPTERFFSYQSLAVLAQAIFMILFGLSVKPGEKSSRFFLLVSRNSFAIYLMHPLLLTILQTGLLGFTVPWNLRNPIFFVPLYAVTIFSICWGIAELWRLMGKYVLAWAGKLIKKEKDASYVHRFVQILGVVILIAAYVLCVKVWDVSFIRPAEISIADAQAIAVADRQTGEDADSAIENVDLNHSIDNMRIVDDGLYIDGWAAIPGIDSQNTRIYITLTNEAGAITPYAVTAYESDTLKDAWEDGDMHAWATFECTVPLADLSPGTYGISVMLEYEGKLYKAAWAREFAYDADGTISGLGELTRNTSSALSGSVDLDIDASALTINENLCSSIDVFAIQENRLDMEGWAAIGGIDSAQTAAYVALTDEHGAKTLYSTTPFINDYLNGVWQDTIYGSAFFTCAISLDMLSPGQYAVTLVLEYDGQIWETAWKREFEYFPDGTISALSELIPYTQ